MTLRQILPQGGYGGPAPETAPRGARGSTRWGQIEGGGRSGAQPPLGRGAAGALAAPPIAASPVAASSRRRGGVVGLRPVGAGKGGDAVGVDPEVAADAGDGFGERELAGVLRVVVEPGVEIAQQPDAAVGAAVWERGQDAAPDLRLAPGGGLARGVRGLAGLRGLAPFLLGVAVFGEPGFEGDGLADGAGDAGELQRRVGGGPAGAFAGGPAGPSAAALIACRCSARARSMPSAPSSASIRRWRSVRCCAGSAGGGRGRGGAKSTNKT